MLQQIATLLLGRGPYAWLGYNYAGDMPQTNMACVHVLGAIIAVSTALSAGVGRPWPAVLDTDVGVPTSNCTEPSPGVFERRYSRGLARLDCNSYTASIPGE